MRYKVTIEAFVEYTLSESDKEFDMSVEEAIAEHWENGELEKVEYTKFDVRADLKAVT